MSGNVIRVKIQVEENDLKSALEKTITSTEGFSVQSQDDSRPSDLLIFEMGGDPKTELDLIHSLLDVGAAGEVFLISQSSDPQVLLRALRTGVKEFFSPAVEHNQVKEALVKLRESKQKKKGHELSKVGQIIDVIGCKGGVGTTTVAVNLAVSLAETKGSPSVALVDRNTLFGEIPLFLEVQPQYHLGEITKDISRLDSTFLMNALSKHSSGVYVLPAQTSINSYPDMTPEVMEELLSLMQKMFDFVIIDGGQSLNKTSLKVSKMSDLIFLISVLSLPCLANTNKLLKAFEHQGYPSREQIRVVMNRCLKNSDISLKDAESSLDQTIFWTIPNDYRITLSAINHGKPLGQLAAKAQVTKNIRNLAHTLTETKEESGSRIWSFFRSSRQKEAR
jgi:pilus assembly protein CpaE